MGNPPVKPGAKYNGRNLLQCRGLNGVEVRRPPTADKSATWTADKCR
jgi:hypothetical protein